MVPSRRARTGRRSAFTLFEVFVVVAVVLVLVALMLPAVQTAREMARRAGCRNNLWQLGLALENYEHAHNVLPPGSVDSTGPIVDDGKGYHMSWVVQILPFIDQGNIYRQFDFSDGVYDQKSFSTTGTGLALLSCPNGMAGYVGCHHDVSAPIDVDNHGVLFLNSSVRSQEIPDGAADTIFLGEGIGNSTGQGYGWMSGTSATLANTGLPINSVTALLSLGAVDLATVRQDIPGGFSSNHGQGAHLLLGGGQVRFVNEGIDLNLLQRLAHRFDGTMIPEF